MCPSVSGRQACGINTYLRLLLRYACFKPKNHRRFALVGFCREFTPMSAPCYKIGSDMIFLARGLPMRLKNPQG